MFGFFRPSVFFGLFIAKDEMLSVFLVGIFVSAFPRTLGFLCSLLLLRPGFVEQWPLER